MTISHDWVSRGSNTTSWGVFLREFKTRDNKTIVTAKKLGNCRSVLHKNQWLLKGWGKVMLTTSSLKTDNIVVAGFKYTYMTCGLACGYYWSCVIAPVWLTCILSSYVMGWFYNMCVCACSVDRWC